MSHTVVVTERAAREIEDAAAWWSRERSTEQALRWYHGIREAIAGLTTSPERFPLAPESADFPYEIRELHYGLGHRRTHRAVFRMKGELLEVLTVRHAARGPLQPQDFA